MIMFSTMKFRSGVNLNIFSTTLAPFFKCSPFPKDETQYYHLHYRLSSTGTLYNCSTQIERDLKRVFDSRVLTVRVQNDSTLNTLLL